MNPITYFIISNSGYFGRGASAADALSNCLKAGARKTDSGSLKIILGAPPAECEFTGSQFMAPETATFVPAVSVTRIGAIRE